MKTLWKVDSYFYNDGKYEDFEHDSEFIGVFTSREKAVNAIKEFYKIRKDKISELSKFDDVYSIDDYREIENGIQYQEEDLYGIWTTTVEYEEIEVDKLIAKEES